MLGFASRDRWVWPGLALALTVGIHTACGRENRHDAYLRGAQLELIAREGPCKLVYDEGQKAHGISGDQVQLCLEATELAASAYVKAQVADPENQALPKVVARMEEECVGLRAMLAQLRRMEREHAAGRPR